MIKLNIYSDKLDEILSLIANNKINASVEIDGSNIRTLDFEKVVKIQNAFISNRSIDSLKFSNCNNDVIKVIIFGLQYTNSIKNIVLHKVPNAGIETVVGYLPSSVNNLVLEDISHESVGIVYFLLESPNRKIIYKPKFLEDLLLADKPLTAQINIASKQVKMNVIEYQERCHSSQGR